MPAHRPLHPKKKTVTLGRGNDRHCKSKANVERA
jgi:hypothetical protein